MNKFIFVLCFVTLGACSTFNIQDPVHKLAVQYATGKFIESVSEDSTIETARKVISYAKNAKELLDLERTSLASVEQKLLDRIDTENLSPADRALASALVSSITDNIQDKIEKGLVEEDKKVTINEILNAIIITAEWYHVSD